MASNDGMVLSAFDLTILPMTGKRMGPSHGTFACRSSRPWSAPVPFGNVLWPMDTTKTATSSVVPLIDGLHAQPYPGITVVYARLAGASNYLFDNNSISPCLDAWLFFPGSQHQCHLCQPLSR
ncbi:hypothetical protein CORC01_09151 [Colletotrichum orchidophilum]|uniref:Uncharacterized protein n=1 Tax=Colletotrichum orchidophilum TaxID=1209926 RepID=A0A1G4B2E4_9PEZI|nr:uncharacterized protein CORC01_09151 [Colletotrichum orchidophilum]OHE95561.1 hypothetical protein CORC01_09151 [Colletotrichum orchidophilum]